MASTLEMRMRAVELVAIGASAGGVDALITLLSGLPARWRLPLVVVLHLPEDHESRLPAVFADRLHLQVHEAQDKEPVMPATLYFAAPGYHLSLERERCFSLSCEPPVLFSRPSIDVLLGSAADAYGPAVAGMVLTGANEDGALGLAQIHRAGGLTAVQDPASAQSTAMPLAASRSHRPDLVAPLPVLRDFLLQMDACHAH
ncbi:chemotaxis protein CheB [Variovorax sp. OV329]|uniref:chemotaxis protein CheB n=1 Tax=Variovorax sp. OV329 TaxID=1882825 RepID=UPI0008ECD236|nr:chemotaxis protein CheB [Variovorax sp. OV329]SFM89768.1 two-component system, chemotaxis family, response regulator CheB [Variovorax sp. OV329]